MKEKGTKMNRRLSTVIMYLVIITLAACGVNKEVEPEKAQQKTFETFLKSYTKEGKSRCIIRLVPECSSYYTDEDGTVNLSVLIPNDRMSELGISSENFNEKIDRRGNDEKHVFLG